MIREAELKDLALITDMAENFSKSLPLPFEIVRLDLMMTAKALIEDGNSIILMHDQGVIAGSLDHLFINKKQVILQERGWWVEPEARKQGIGDDLRKAFEEWGKSRGATVISMITVGGGGDANLKAEQYFQTEQVYWRMI